MRASATLRARPFVTSACAFRRATSSSGRLSSFRWRLQIRMVPIGAYSNLMGHSSSLFSAARKRVGSMKAEKRVA